MVLVREVYRGGVDCWRLVIIVSIIAALVSTSILIDESTRILCYRLVGL
jgi:hypothetical protein